MSIFENLNEYRKDLLEEKMREIEHLKKELDGKDTSNLDLKITPYVVKNGVCGR